MQINPKSNGMFFVPRPILSKTFHNFLISLVNGQIKNQQNEKVSSFTELITIITKINEFIT